MNGRESSTSASALRGGSGSRMTSPDVLTVSEVAARLGCCAATVKKRIRENRLPAINLGTERQPDYRIPVVQFEQLLSGMWRQPSSPPDPVTFRGTLARKQLG
jgi:excisionase family DNA binding protein